MTSATRNALAGLALIVAGALAGCSAGAEAPSQSPSADAAARSAVECPQAFVDATIAGPELDAAPENAMTVTQIEPAEVEPAAVGSVLVGGCAFVMHPADAEANVSYYEAYVPGGQDVIDELDAALVDDGFQRDGNNSYRGFSGLYVSIYVSDRSLFLDSQLADGGTDFLGDEFLIVSVYQSEV